MIDSTTYRARRDRIRGSDGRPVLLPGHRLQPRNYPDNVYPFRQNSHVLYFCGLDRPDLALVVGATPDEDVLYGPEEGIDDVVWHGPHETLEEAAARAGVGRVRPTEELAAALAGASAGGPRYLPPYQADVACWMGDLLRKSPAAVREGADADLVRTVARLRSVKSEDEVAEIEDALEVTARMHARAREVARPGAYESEVAAAVQAEALKSDRAQAYNPIVTVRGEVLHNNDYGNRLEEGQLLLNDSGAESPLYYASDITRTFPVGGTFTKPQRDVYDVVLDAQRAAIAKVAPGVPFRDVHLEACRSVAAGLLGLGLMRGSPDDAVEAGAHALFFPHGVGHMLGLDVHDMEDLGDVVGYPEGEPRSTQFGLDALRMARPLEEGFVFTVEPGIYFIPALIDRWKAEGRAKDFVDYDAVEHLRGLGGVRIEDDVLCTADGPRVLGPGIPK